MQKSRGLKKALWPKMCKYEECAKTSLQLKLETSLLQFWNIHIQWIKDNKG